VTPAVAALPIAAGYSGFRDQSILYRPRGLEDWQIWLTLQGTGWIGAPERGWPTGVDELILYRPGQPQRYTTADPKRLWRVVWVIFRPRPHWLEDLRWPGGGPEGAQPDEAEPMRLIAPPEHRSALLEQFDRILGWTASGDLRRLDWAMNELERLLLLCSRINPEAEVMKFDERVRLALEWIGRHPDRPLSLEGIAEAANTSAAHLQRLFRKQVGLSPIRYHEQQRLQRAMQLLSVTGQPIAQVAQSVGFADPFYFSTRFKRLVGQSPSAYRRSLGGDKLGDDTLGGDTACSARS
jgi:AraC family transcriptional regulator of arabinose operon